MSGYVQELSSDRTEIGFWNEGEHTCDNMNFLIKKISFI